MASLTTRLRRNKQRLEEKLKEKQERRNRLGKDLFDFPNLTIPLLLITFMPAFLILWIAGIRLERPEPVLIFSMFWTVFGLVTTQTILMLEKRWFTSYGSKKILIEPIPCKKVYWLLYIVCCAIIVAVGLMVQSGRNFFLFSAVIITGSLFLALHKDAILWDMPPVYLMGFRKFRFTPRASDNHATRGLPHNGLIRKPKKLKEDAPIEGTFIGNGWFYLRKTKD